LSGDACGLTDLDTIFVFLRPQVTRLWPFRFGSSPISVLYTANAAPVVNDRSIKQRPINRAVPAFSRIDPAWFYSQGINALAIPAIKAHYLMKTLRF
jgi:hypothetical protein